MAESCLLHFCDVPIESDLDTFTQKRWQATKASAQKWSELDGEERKIAQGVLNFDTCPQTCGYHLQCYARFNNNRRIEQAKKRLENGRKTGVVSPKKHLRRREEEPSTSNILPAVCLLCRKSKWIKSMGKRAPERLCQVGPIIMTISITN